MKKLFFIIIFSFSLSANATNWLTYYVYFETNYVQGPWSRFDILQKSDFKYLKPFEYEDLFGSEKVDMVNKMLFRLKGKKPDTYNWDYEINLINDTVILTSNNKIKDIETIKNEITATLTLNSFKAVTFQFPSYQETLTINNLTIPYFDLVVASPSISSDLSQSNPTQIDSNKALKPLNSLKDQQFKIRPSWLSIGLFISIILNIVLIAVLIKRNIRKKTNT